MKRIYVLALLAVAVSVSAADQPAAKSGTSKKKPAAPASAPAAPVAPPEHPGKVVFARLQCATCHAVDLKGNPPMTKILGVSAKTLDLTRTIGSKQDAELKTVIAKGKGKMPAYETMAKPEEIDSLVAYVRSLMPQKPR